MAVGTTVDQMGDVGRATHFIELLACCQFAIQRDEIDWKMMLVQTLTAFPHPLMLDDVEVLTAEKFADAPKGFGIDQDRTEHGFFRFNRMRR